MVESIAHLGLVDEDDILLDQAALEIAALDHEETALEPYHELLDRMTVRLEEKAGETRTTADQAKALADVIAEEFSFEGDRDTYDDPANADLISVMDRRRGLPVALAILYVALARRLGWTANALNTPGHVLVGVGQGRPLLIDPFNRGAVIRPEQLASLLQAAFGARFPTRGEQVSAMSNRAVLLRLLTNQAIRAEQAQELGRALTIQHRITTVGPGYAHGWWDRARLELALGEPAAARDSLTAMLETTRDPELLARAKSQLEAIAG